MRFLLAVLLAAVAVPVAADAKSITGSLAGKGWTVVAVGYDGESRAAPVKSGRFTITSAPARSTINFRDDHGRYAGVLVVGKKGKRAVLGVRAGAKLGKLKLRSGVARPAHRPAGRFVDRARQAVTKAGAPIGAGRFGLVRSRATGSSGGGGDLDLDGVPNALDIDDDGDLVLDNNDRSTSSRQLAPAPGAADQAGTLRMFSNFHFSLAETLNANAGGVTREAIDAAMTRANSFVGLVFFLPTGVEEVELDCGGLSYCSAGGTGKAAEPFPDGRAFPSCCDADGDGLGTITRGPTGDFQLRTLAVSSAIGSGDTFVELLPDGTQLTGALNYMFNTTPAVSAYRTADGATTTVAYPAAAGAPGTSDNPVPLTADGAGDYTLGLRFWRPQRDAIAEAGEAAGFVDMGGLKYQVMVPNAPQAVNGGPSGGPTAGAGACQMPAALTEDDPNLTPQGATALVDGLADGPANPANTLEVKIDFTKCLAQAGQTLGPGQQLQWEIQALSQVNDVAAQGWWVCVPLGGKSDCKRTPQNPNPPPNPPAG